MVVWEDGKMKKSDYRKFIIRGEAMPEGGEKAAGVLRDDFAVHAGSSGAALPPAAGGE